MKVGNLKLSEKEYKVIEKIRREGCWVPPHAQVPTVKNLISKGICDWDKGYISLILTQKGKEIEL